MSVEPFTKCFTKESRSLYPILHDLVILPYIHYTVGYLNKVLCSYESVGLNVQAKHKIGHHDLYFMVQ